MTIGKEPIPTTMTNADDPYGYEASERSEGHSSRVARRTNVTAEVAPHDLSFRPKRVLLYSPPRQRQKWGDTQILPRVNWGDIFFDLFYVAATYNVSAILVDSPSKEGLLYAAGTFLPIMGIWLQKTIFDARYVTEADVYHRCVNILVMVVLGVAVLQIRTVAILSNTSEKPSMFVFALMLVVERLIAILQYAEVFFRGVGQRQIKHSAWRDGVAQGCSLPFYLAACVIAGKDFFGYDRAGSRFLADTPTYTALATEQTNIPIQLCLFGYIGGIFFLTIVVVFFFPSGGRHKDIAVPINIDFVIHRSGEWIMLMLGETVFSLLIVDVENEGDDFFIVFYCGILTVVFLQILHFQSQPHDAKFHAMRRNKNAGMFWNQLHQVYSFALTTLGAAYTFFLFSSDDTDSGERLLMESRSLAGADITDTEEKAAHLFAGTLAVIFFCLDGMTLLHLGVNESSDRCALKRQNKNFKGIAVVMMRVALLAATATLSLWETNPAHLSMIGLAFVLLQLILRKLGKIFLSHSSKEHGAMNSPSQNSDEGESHWPNVTHARAEPAPKKIAVDVES